LRGIAEDLGSQLCYWKLALKNYKPDDPLLPKAICEVISHKYLESGDTKSVDQFLFRLRKKLFKNHHVSEYALTAQQA